MIDDNTQPVRKKYVLKARKIDRIWTIIITAVYCINFAVYFEICVIVSDNVQTDGTLMKWVVNALIDIVILVIGTIPSLIEALLIDIAVSLTYKFCGVTKAERYAKD